MDEFYMIHKTLITLVAPSEYWNIVSDIEGYLGNYPEANFYDWLANSELYGNQGLQDDQGVVDNFHDSLTTPSGNIALELLTQSNIDIWNTVPSKPTNKLVPDPEDHYQQTRLRVDDLPAFLLEGPKQPRYDLKNNIYIL